MHVLMLSWEYPPLVVGGLGRHVPALAGRLAARGHDVVVLSRQPDNTDATTHPSSDEIIDGVRVLRVAEDPPHLEFGRDLVAWTLGMGHAMVRAGLALLRDWQPDVVHAHDWLVAHPAIALGGQAGVPLVVTMHATEAGRHSGWLTDTVNQQVHSVEWWLVNAADEVITCSAAMRAEVAQLFDLTPEGVTVLHNGIEPYRWRRAARSEVEAARSRHGGAGGPVLLYFGRLEWEKGVQDLLAALPRIRATHPGARLVVAGDGRQATSLVEQARRLRIRRAVDFCGQLPETELPALLAAADVVALPSRYEPFGLVALEAAAAGAPMVVSTVGGLGELVRDGETGLTFAPGDVDGIAGAVRTVLDQPAAARRRAVAARRRLRTDFDWDDIADRTAALYSRARRGAPVTLGRPKIPTGNAFGK